MRIICYQIRFYNKAFKPNYKADAYRIKLFAQNDRAGVIKPEAWKMGTIWRD